MVCSLRERKEGHQKRKHLRSGKKMAEGNNLPSKARSREIPPRRRKQQRESDEATERKGRYSRGTKKEGGKAGAECKEHCRATEEGEGAQTNTPKDVNCEGRVWERNDESTFPENFSDPNEAREDIGRMGGAACRRSGGQNKNYLTCKPPIRQDQREVTAARRGGQAAPGTRTCTLEKIHEQRQ